MKLNQQGDQLGRFFCEKNMTDEQKFCFRLGDVALDQATENKKRTFSGVAYSGEPITDHWYWDRIIFDLDSMQIKGRIPALLEHSSRQRAGAIDDFKIDHATGLTVSGTLMSNEFGTQVAQDSDDGFPWQMSVRIEPATIEEIEKGEVTVNGKTYQAPITVFRGGRIREVSFCALGADDNTNAVAASHQPKFTQQEDTNVTELEQAKAAQAKAEQERDAAQAELKKFHAQKRTDDITALETSLGKTFSEDEKKQFAALPDDAFNLMSGQLKQFSSKPESQPAPSANPNLAHLFTHQATGGQGGSNSSQGTSLDQAFNNFAASKQGGN